MQGSRVAAGSHEDHATRVMAYRRLASPELVLTAHSAAWALGARFADPSEPVSCAVRTGSRPRRRDEVVPHRLAAGAEVIETGQFGWVTSPVWTAVDLARGLNRGSTSTQRSTAEVDALLRATGCTVTEARMLAADLRRLHGLPRARQVLAAARDGVDSFQETRVRLLLTEAGLPDPTVQCPVRDENGVLIARLDLGWPDLKVGLEYDGAVHRGQRQHSVDLRRHNLLRALGWRVIQVDAEQMRRPLTVVTAVRTLLLGA
jgi:hypothetical protein